VRASSRAKIFVCDTRSREAVGENNREKKPGRGTYEKQHMGRSESRR
jgi:hypothetical protein